MLISAGRLVAPHQVLEPGWLAWSGERITGVGSGGPPRQADLDLPTATMCPGFIDVHVHGGGGAGFGESQQSALTVVKTHRARGTTTMVASLVSAPSDELERSVRSLSELVASDELAGIHLEGPWLSGCHNGAHAKELLRAPSRDEVHRLLEAGCGSVRMVTLAPELDGGIDAVRQIVAAGAIVAVGHTDATYAQTVAALDAGATVGTHLFNAMRPMHHREPGPALALLQRQGAFVEVIADGVHLHPAVVRAAMNGAARPIFVTDAMAAAGAGDGDYRLGDIHVTVSSGRAVLPGTETIAGSTLTTDGAVRYAVTVAGIPLLDAVRAATSTPADVLGRPDLGRLMPGARADLVVLNEHLVPTTVVRRGQLI